MNKKIFTVSLSLAILLVMAVVTEAALTTKQISATYRDIKLYVNGSAVTVPSNEVPFIYNGRTFVPIRLVAEALNLNVEWVDALNSVRISSKSAAQPPDPNILAQKDKEIQDLKLQLAQKNSEIQRLNNTIASLKKDNDSVDELEDQLVSDYDNLENVKIDEISLDGDEDDIDVNIEVDLADYGDEWDALDDSDIEDWIEDMVNDIQDDLSDDTEVTGSITDTDSNDVLVEFTKDGNSSLDVDFKDEDYRDGGSGSNSGDIEDVEDSLQGDSFYVDSIRFTITDINYDSDDDITVALKSAVSNTSTKWDALGNSTINSEVKDICEEIAGTFEDDADADPETVSITFLNENNATLDSYEYNVDDGDLD